MSRSGRRRDQRVFNELLVEAKKWKPKAPVGPLGPHDIVAGLSPHHPALAADIHRGRKRAKRVPAGLYDT